MTKNNEEAVFPAKGSFYKDENGDRVVVIELDRNGVKYAPEGRSTEQLVSYQEFCDRFRPADVVGPDVVADQPGDSTDNKPESKMVKADEKNKDK